jgi:hypothetical protein
VAFFSLISLMCSVKCFHVTKVLLSAEVRLRSNCNAADSTESILNGKGISGRM